MNDESREALALALYREARVDDQLRFYSATAAEYERANAQSVSVAAVLLSVTTLAGTLAGLDIAGKLAWAVVAAVIPAVSTALAAYESLFGFERVGKLYSDAVRSLRRLEAPDLAAATGEADAAEKVASYAVAVETVLRNEQSQWGQLTAKLDVPGETDAK